MNQLFTNYMPLNRLSCINMAEQYQWANSIYIYSAGHANNIDQKIDSIKSQKGEVCSLEDFKQFDVLHLGGHDGLDSLIQEVNITHTNTILDVGSGLGGSSRHLHVQTQATVHGLDLLPQFVRLCEKMTLYTNKADKLSYKQGDISTIDLPENIYEGAYSIAVYLVYILGNSGMKNVYRSLKPGGWFYLEDWYALMPLDQMPQEIRNLIVNDLGFVNLHTEAQIREELIDAGFTIEYFEDNGNLKSEAAWERSQRILKQYQDQGEEGDAVFIRSVTDYGINTTRLCPQLDHLSPEQIRERYPTGRIQFIDKPDIQVMQESWRGSHYFNLLANIRSRQVQRQIFLFEQQRTKFIETKCTVIPTYITHRDFVCYLSQYSKFHKWLQQFEITFPIPLYKLPMQELRLLLLIKEEPAMECFVFEEDQLTRGREECFQRLDQVYAS